MNFPKYIYVEIKKVHDDGWVFYIIRQFFRQYILQLTYRKTSRFYRTDHRHFNIAHFIYLISPWSSRLVRIGYIEDGCLLLICSAAEYPYTDDISGLYDRGF